MHKTFLNSTNWYHSALAFHLLMAFLQHGLVIVFRQDIRHINVTVYYEGRNVPSYRESLSIFSDRIFHETCYFVSTTLLYFVSAEVRSLHDFLNLSNLFSSIVYVHSGILISLPQHRSPLLLSFCTSFQASGEVHQAFQQPS